MAVESAKAASSHLPTPEERPGADVVIYDGHCRICTSQVRKLLWWDSKKRLAYVSLHDPFVGEKYPDLTHDRLMQEMVIVDRNGRRHFGAEAIRYLTLRLPKLWWASPILWFPGSMFLWRFLYRKIANSRYKFGKIEDCDGGSCSLHRH
jgi:predicted DCC family thiol-disulfide oxidoreductase YuxK